jgi:lysophospholipase L1-like esterase
MVAVLTPTLIATLLLLQGPARREPARLRVMPLGDSITQGGQGFASWRYPLWYSLPSAPAVDFVGGQAIVFGGDGGSNPNTALYPGYYTSFDREHEGWWGYRTDQIEALAFAAASAARPDVVLVHLGTNDVGQSGASGVANAATYLPRILWNVRAARPGASFLVAQVVPIGPGTSYFANAGSVASLNATIATVVAAEDSPGSRVVLVDQHTGFDLANDMQPDGLHPDVSGENRMAAVWLAALEENLAPPLPPRQPAALVLDPSFETLASGDGVVSELPSATPWRFGATPNTFRGIFNPTADSYLGAAGSGTPLGADGDEVAYLYDNGSGAEAVVAYQTLATTCELGKTYTLTVAIGNRLASNPYGPSTYGGFRLELLAGNERLGALVDSLVPAPGTFADATLVVRTDALPVRARGRALTVRLGLTASAAGSATDFDRVRLAVE